MISSIRKDNSYIFSEVTGTGRAQADSLAVCSLCDKIAETAGFTTYNQQERRKLMRGYFGDVRKNSLAIYMARIIRSDTFPETMSARFSRTGKPR